MLQYMLDHNIHHAGELSDMAKQFSGEAQHQLLHAVESFDQANGYLSAAVNTAPWSSVWVCSWIWA